MVSPNPNWNPYYRREPRNRLPPVLPSMHIGSPETICFKNVGTVNITQHITSEDLGTHKSNRCATSPKKTFSSEQSSSSSSSASDQPVVWLCYKAVSIGAGAGVLIAALLTPLALAIIFKIAHYNAPSAFPAFFSSNVANLISTITFTVYGSMMVLGIGALFCFCCCYSK